MKKLQNKFILLISVLFIGFASSCDSNNPEGIPSYIQIDTAYFNVHYPDIQGSSSSYITDVWVYIDNQIQGVYELPVTFPVLKSGSPNVYLRAGIRVDGMVDWRAYYPHYERFTVESINLVRGEIARIEPTFTYASPDHMTFAWMEDFENFSSSFVTSNLSDTSLMVITGSNVFEGNFSGMIVLDNNKRYFEIQTQENFKIPEKTNGVYLEFDFKVETDSTMMFGAKFYYESNIVQYLAVNIRHKKGWRKMYINLDEAMGMHYNATSFELFFSGGTLDTITKMNRNEYFIDNIKFIY